MNKLLLLSLSLCLSPGLAREQASVPYIPALITDSKGHEWYIEQSGVLQRQGTGASMIGNCMALQFGGQQLYAQQAMTTPDGREITMTSQQPQGGMSIRRRITVLEREGALRYVDEFTNTTSRDLQVTVELRHGLNNTAREVTSNLGRPIKDALEAGETGILALAGEGENRAPDLLFTLRASDSSLPLKLRIQNKYQISVLYTLSLPAGQTQALIHGVAQIRTPAKAAAEEISRLCAPLSLTRLTRDLPRSLLKTAVNLGEDTSGFGIDEWHPKTYWGLSPETSDQLAMGKGSLLKGRLQASTLTLLRESERITLPFDQVAAMAGSLFTQDAQAWIWLRDGQRWCGQLETLGLNFTLNSGAELSIKQLDRLVLAQPLKTPEARQATLIELRSGERLAMLAEGDLPMNTPWGSWQVPWREIVALKKSGKGQLGGLLCLRDGTQIRALPRPGPQKLKLLNLGEQEIEASDICGILSPLALTMKDADTEPTTAFLDLIQDQRLVAKITLAQITLLTEAGPLSLAPGTIRELRDASSDDESVTRLFEAALWGGGEVKGSLEELRLPVEGLGLSWQVPVRHLRRMSNPVPLTDPAIMRRIGQLIQDLGSENWQTREAASQALRELGALARSSLQEALKAQTDAEASRRLEELLQDPE